MKDWKHLLALQHPLELEIWEGSYPNKVFDAKAAAEAAERVSKRIEEQKNEAEQRKKAEKSAKAKAQRRSGTSAGVSMAGVKRSTKQTTVGDTSKVSTSVQAKGEGHKARDGSCFGERQPEYNMPCMGNLHSVAQQLLCL